MYRLESNFQVKMQQEIKEFIKSYTTTIYDDDIKNSIFDESKTALHYTLQLVNQDIKELIDYRYKEYMDNKICNHIINEYNKLIKNSISKVNAIDSHSKLDALKIALKSANMNYIIKINEKYFYPFLYDLIIMSFSLRMSIAVHYAKFMKPSALADEVDRIESSYLEEDITDYYLYKELIKLIKGIPEEAKELKNFLENLEEDHESINDLKYIHPTTILLIKHYSEVLGVECKKVLSVFHQLVFQENYKKGRNENKCTAKIEKIKLSFHPDSLREKSLYVI